MARNIFLWALLIFGLQQVVSRYVVVDSNAVMDYANSNEEDGFLNDSIDVESPFEYDHAAAPVKRTRYYRKYPGKRQNRKVFSDIYDCAPSRTETVKLLFAIHQARQGDVDHFVLCNRLRNPKAILPNPRYIGKRTQTDYDY